MTFDIGPADWASFEEVMGEKGGCGGCWCMLWRKSKKQMDADMGAANRKSMGEIFESSAQPGLVARYEGSVVGWIQVDRRDAFPRLKSSRVLKPVDDREVWSVSCFFIDKKYRRQGLSRRLLDAACDWAKNNGASCLEGYPIDTPKAKYPPVYAWTGFVGAFKSAGFVEVARRSDTRPIMRKELSQN